MTDRIDLPPTEEDIQHWIDTFLPSPELWWWDDSAIPNEASAARVIPRGEHREDEIAGNIAWVNAYLAWQMTPATKRVIVDDGGWFAGLSEGDRQRARELQVELRRGKVVPRDRFGLDAVIPANAIVTNLVVLDGALWRSIQTSTKRSVLQHELADWDRATSYAVPESAPAHVTGIANQFVHQEGVNCLAVVVYAMSANRDDLHKWMLPQEFESHLRNYGYTVIAGVVPQSGDVIVFRGAEGEIVHAAYALTPDRFLNKSGQTSFNPIAILNQMELHEDWAEFSISVWRRHRES